MALERQDLVPDYRTLWALTFAHCIAVILLLCGCTAVCFAVLNLLHFEGEAAAFVALALLVMAPLILAVAAARFTYRFIICRVARTDAGRKLFGLLIMVFAMATPFYMFPLGIAVWCTLAQWTGSSCSEL